MITIPAALNQEDRAAYFQKYDEFVSLFGKEAVDGILATVPVNSLVELHYSPKKDHSGKTLQGSCFHKPSKLLGSEMNYHKFYQGDWEKTVRVPCNVYLVSNRYQSLVYGGMIDALLLQRAFWLGGYQLQCYGPDEFYVTVLAKDAGHHTSLYVPIKAWVAGDVDAIIKRNVDYFKWYTGKDDASKAILDSDVTKSFLKLTAENKETANV